MDSTGNLYGTTGAGHNNFGTVFELTGNKESVLHKFTGGADGASPYLGSLVMDGSGNLYGMTQVGGGGDCVFGGAPGCGTVFKISGKHETVLHSFMGLPDGADSPGGLIIDSAGNLYGTTIIGGTVGNSDCPEGCGTVFKVDPTGNETVLYSFCPKMGCADGAAPYGGLILDEKTKTLYGTTWGGGTSTGGGGGTVFKLTETGKETVLYSFCSRPNCTDGSSPIAQLIIDKRGNLYGTTYFGGTGSCPQAGGGGCGTVFKLSANGKETVLHSFCSKSNCSDGLYPSAGLFLDANGNLYGTTVFGGTGPCPARGGGCGTVFEVHAGVLGTLHSFTGVAPDGAYPYSTLIMDAGGNLYGTAASGGKSDGGVIFEITP